MCSKKMFLKLIAAAIVVVVFTACGGNKGVSTAPINQPKIQSTTVSAEPIASTAVQYEEGGIYPDRIYEGLRQEELFGKLYTVGEGTANDDKGTAHATMLAKERARNEIKRFFGEQTDAIIKIFDDVANLETVQHMKSTGETKVDQYISGIRDLTYYNSKRAGNGVVTVYVIMYIDLDNLQKTFDRIAAIALKESDIRSEEAKAARKLAEENYKELDKMLAEKKKIKQALSFDDLNYAISAFLNRKQ